MKDVTTYVGIDAHKKDLFVAMLIGQAKTPVTWQLANEPQAVRRLVRKLEREAPRVVRVCVATSNHEASRTVRRRRPGADTAQGRGARQDRSARRAEAGGTRARRFDDCGAAAEPGGRSGPGLGAGAALRRHYARGRHVCPRHLTTTCQERWSGIRRATAW